MTPEETTKQVVRIKKAFPSLPKGFYEILLEQAKELDMTDAQFRKATNNVINTSQYPTPTIGQFIMSVFTETELNFKAFLKR